MQGSIPCEGNANLYHADEMLDGILVYNISKMKTQMKSLFGNV